MKPTGASRESTTLRACVAYEVPQKPKVECQERKEHESPPVTLHTEEDGNEEYPRGEKTAHDDRLFQVLTRPRVGATAPIQGAISRQRLEQLRMETQM